MNAATQETNGKREVPKPTLVARDIPISLIDENPNNPRKTFVGVEDLAKDVAVNGVLQPALVRPKGRRFELVFGARRFRASKLAKLEALPCTVRELDDAKALELMIVENSQREDIHPLEEADGYLALHKKHDYTVDEIAAKVGKSANTIYARLKYSTLIPEARNAFFDERLSAATALLIARIPHPDLQKKALAEITRKGWQGEIPGVREATRIVRDRFMLRLVDAPFDRADTKLVAAAGACASCPKRTGNQKELFADLESKDDLCTDPKCFTAKRDADAEIRIATAKEKGHDVLVGKASKKLFNGTRLQYDSGYVDLADKEWNDSGKEKTKRAVLGGADVKVVIARDAEGNVHELVAAKDYAKATKKPAPKASKAEQRYATEQEADKKRRARENAKKQSDIIAIAQAAERRKPTDAFWRAIAVASAHELGIALDAALERRELLEENEDVVKVATKAIAKMTGAQARGFFVELLVSASTETVRKDLAKFFGAKKR